MDVIDVNHNKIIESDEDTQEQDLYDGCLYPYDVDPEEIDVREDKLSIFEFLRKLTKGQIIVDPEFQRNLVWKQEQQCRFIESIILSIPLPPLYVNQDINGKYIIIDGRQRPLTLSTFMPDKGEGFRLIDLKALPRLNGLCFKELSSDIQTTIEDKQLRLYIIKPSVPIEVVYDIFNRINTGGTQLNRQEIRNCIYKGKATRLLKELSEKEYFKQAIDNGISPNRMKDREAILRYLAFKIMDYQEDYKNEMDSFLGKAIEKLNKMNDSEFKELEKDFERVMKLTYDFFGNKNYRIPTIRGRGRINTAVMESVSFFFSKNNDAFLYKNKYSITKNYEKLLKDDTYRDSVRFSTGDTKRVRNRFSIAPQTLANV